MLLDNRHRFDKQNLEPKNNECFRTRSNCIFCLLLVEQHFVERKLYMACMLAHRNWCQLTHHHIPNSDLVVFLA